MPTSYLIAILLLLFVQSLRTLFLMYHSYERDDNASVTTVNVSIDAIEEVADLPKTIKDTNDDGDDEEEEKIKANRV